MPFGASSSTRSLKTEHLPCGIGDNTPRPLPCMMDAQVEELPETASRTIAAEWGAQTAGGSHIHPDWKKNPCFHLKLRTTGPAKASKMLPIAVFSPLGRVDVNIRYSAERRHSHCSVSKCLRATLIIPFVPRQLRISVSRPEKDWKNKCIRDSVGCMMGFYLMAGSKPNRNQAIFHEASKGA